MGAQNTILWHCELRNHRLRKISAATSLNLLWNSYISPLDWTQSVSQFVTLPATTPDLLGPYADLCKPKSYGHCWRFSSFTTRRTPLTKKLACSTLFTYGSCHKILCHHQADRTPDGPIGQPCCCRCVYDDISLVYQQINCQPVATGSVDRYSWDMTRLLCSWEKVKNSIYLGNPSYRIHGGHYH